MNARPATAPRRRDWLLPLAAAVMLATALATLFPFDVAALPERFAEVEPGRLYRGGYQHPLYGTVGGATLRRIVDTYGIRTLVSLTRDAPDESRTCEEQRVVADRGLKYWNFPMPGDGHADFHLLTAAADCIAAALADPAQRPVYFRCAAGKQRTNAVLAVYRMRHCGWTLEAALAELDRYGLDRTREALLCEHLAKYARSESAGANEQAAMTVGHPRAGHEPPRAAAR